jgi:hypothetical protein
MERVKHNHAGRDRDLVLFGATRFLIAAKNF